MNPLNWIVVAVLAFVASAGYTFVTGYRDQASTISQLQHDVAMKDARLVSYKRMIDRRDDAINASKCTVQIKQWVSNPDLLPKKFDPFNQLNNGTLQ